MLAARRIRLRHTGEATPWQTAPARRQHERIVARLPLVEQVLGVDEPARTPNDLLDEQFNHSASGPVDARRWTETRGLNAVPYLLCESARGFAETESQRLSALFRSHPRRSATLPEVPLALRSLLARLERVLKRQIEQDLVIVLARTDADREGDAGHDLQSRREIVAPPQAWAHVE